MDSTAFARDHLGLTPLVFDRVLPRTTIASAEKSVSRTLSTAASETLFRLSRLTAIAEEAFGDPKRAHHSGSLTGTRCSKTKRPPSSPALKRGRSGSKVCWGA